MKNAEVAEISDTALKEQVETSIPEADLSEEIKNEADKVVESIIDNVTKVLTDESLSTNGCQEQVESPQDKNSIDCSHSNNYADDSMQPIEKENKNIEKVLEMNKSDEQELKLLESNKSDVQREKVIEIDKCDVKDEKVLEDSESDVLKEKDTKITKEKEVVLTEVNGSHSNADVLM